MKIHVPDYIASLIPYVPGKPIEEVERELGITGSIKMASNENPLGPSPMAVTAIRANLDKLNYYPDGEAFYLKRKASERLGVPPEKILFGNGSDELLDIVCKTFCREGDEAVMGKPAFIEYFIISKTCGLTPVEVPLRTGYIHDLDAMARVVTAKTKVIFIANPNNPTGTIVTKTEFDAFMPKVPEHVVVVLDEAYFEYCLDASSPNGIEYTDIYPNVISLRTFSKAYGLPALRLGYAVANPEVIATMNKARPPFNVSSLAQIGGIAAFDDLDHLTFSINNNEIGKAQIYSNLDKLGIGYTPTSANFVLIDLGKPAKSVYERMLAKGVIVRPLGGYGMPNHIRVTIGRPEENKKFIAVLIESL